MKLLHSVPAANGSVSFFLPKGQFGNFFIRYQVVAAAGVTLTRKNFGNVILNWNGQDVINVDADIINRLDNVYGGTSEFTSAVGASAKLSCFLTSGLWFDNSNVYDISGRDNVYIKLDFSDLADSAITASGNVQIFGKNKTGVMTYLHNMIARPVTSSGAGTMADSYPINNVTEIYLKDPTALLSSVQVVKDNETLVDADPSTLISYSDFIHQLETTNNTLAIDFVESLDIREAIGATVNYKYVFTAAGILEQYFSFIDFTPAKARESSDVAAAKFVPVLPAPPGSSSPANIDSGRMTTNRAQQLIAAGLF